MSPKKIRWIVIGIVVMLSAAGCKCDQNQIDVMEIIHDSPLAGEVINTLLPTFTFHNSENCEPHKYWLRFTDNSESGWRLNGTTLDDSPTFTMTNPLDPGKEYTWKVLAYGGDLGGTDYTEPTVFYTGPICSGESLVAPDLQDPQSAAWLEEQTNFVWTYNGGCLPHTYEVQFAMDAAFTDIYLTATTTEPYAQHLLMAFPDCSTMFWRVRASDGTNFGPWSTSRDFHYVISDVCYQWTYPSENFARIDVKLAYDRCDQTGEIAAWTESLNFGCEVEGTIIMGAGEYAAFMSDFVVDLGSGPCPSSGLDQKSDEYYSDSFYNEARFGVVTPGTYCVSISKNQSTRIIGENRMVNLQDGVWTLPRTNQIITERTIELPGDWSYLNSGIQIVQLTFLWDEIERNFLTYPLDFTYACKLGPEKLCPTTSFAPAGEVIPILARDRTSDWKLVDHNGMLCYILLPDTLIEQSLVALGPESPSLEDLGYFHPPDPCNDPGSSPGQNDSCAVHTDRTSCSNAGCLWVPDGSTRSGGYCTSR